MRPWRNSLLPLVVTALCLGQSASQLMRPEIRRVGAHLACLCGNCKNTVGDCAMIGCHYSHPAREKIDKLLAEGKPDQAIVARFVKDEGRRALAMPPAEGFHLLAWVMPFVAIAFGLAGIVWFVRTRLRRPGTAVALDDELVSRYRERMDRDLAKLD